MADNQAAIAERLEKHLDSEIAKARRASTITLAVGLAAAVILAGYLGYLRTQVTELADPSQLSQDLTRTATSQLREMRVGLATTLTRNADTFITDGIEAALGAVVEFRLAAEDRLLAELDEALIDAKAYFDLALAQALDDAESELRLAARDLLTEEGANMAEDDLYFALLDMVGEADVRYDLAAYAIALDGLAGRIERLRDAVPGELGPKDRAQRDLLFALKEMSDRYE